MKKIIKAICLVTAATLFVAFCPKEKADAGTVAKQVISDDFSDKTLDSALWEASGADVAPSDTKGALVIRSITGYSHSVWFQALSMENGNDYTVTFDTSVKSATEAWLGVVIGAKGVGAIYNNRCESGFVFTAKSDNAVVDHYRNGDSSPYERINSVNYLRNDGNENSIKIDLKYDAEAGDYDADVYLKPSRAESYGDKCGTFSVKGVAGGLAFQSNGDGSVVKVSSLKIYKGEELIESENFEKPTKELLCMTDDRDGKRWIAQNENYSSGMGKALKFTDSENGRLKSKYAIKKNPDNVKNFNLAFSFSIENVGDGNGFGVSLGKNNNEIYFEKSGDKYSIIQKTGDNKTVLNDSVALSDSDKVELIGNYKNEVEIYLDGKKIGNAENVDFAGNFSIGTFGRATAYLTSLDLVQYDYEVISAKKISTNFNAMKNGSQTAGYTDDAKWTAVGNCAARNGVLKFQSGDVNTSFNTTEKYQDFILRFDVTRIVASFTRDEDETYAVPGTYSDMSLGVSVGKKTYNESSISGEHASLQFCTKYWNKNADGRIIPNMIIWGYGVKTASGDTAGWPSECWWHDGADGKLVTENGVKINVMIVAKNRTIKVYYKYDYESEAAFDEAKAEFVNVDTYGYVGISCGYNSTFEIDNLSIVPISFENYL